MSLKDFEVLAPLGVGSYSQVFKCRRRNDGQLYALKKVRIQTLNPKEQQNALNEVRLLASLQHEHVIRFKETFIDYQQQLLCIVMQHADQGDLQAYIKHHRGTLVDEATVWKCLIETTMGLAALHRLNVLHRDIKAGNVFLVKNKFVLGDLNVSKESAKGLAYTQTGTPFYASPEVWRDEPYDAKSDIWSLGCLIYELCTAHPPFQASSLPALFQIVQQAQYTPISQEYSSQLHFLLDWMMQSDPTDRPSCEQLLHYIRQSNHKHSHLITSLPDRSALLGDIPLLTKDGQPDLLGIQKILPTLQNYNNTSMEVKSQENQVRPKERRHVVSAGVKDRYRNFIRVLENKKEKLYSDSKRRVISEFSNQPHKQPINKIVPPINPKEFHERIKQKSQQGQQQPPKKEENVYQLPERPQTRESTRACQKVQKTLDSRSSQEISLQYDANDRYKLRTKGPSNNTTLRQITKESNIRNINQIQQQLQSHKKEKPVLLSQDTRIGKQPNQRPPSSMSKNKPTRKSSSAKHTIGSMQKSQGTKRLFSGGKQGPSSEKGINKDEVQSYLEQMQKRYIDNSKTIYQIKTPNTSTSQQLNKHFLLKRAAPDPSRKSVQHLSQQLLHKTSKQLAGEKSLQGEHQEIEMARRKISNVLPSGSAYLSYLTNQTKTLSSQALKNFVPVSKSSNVQQLSQLFQGYKGQLNISK